ncbi:site-specific recombinase XerD [Kribbella antiqua]|uniref:Site-specific recombinase XerD n=1 Tax=Kribbella antiqua TaxID=2512217 RepID=A0A4R2I9B5_9ACTN|nr:tyrosine-type recombinase/integrase [Kribbella antiqua]TCO41011.1 site-specific recombinase XerD [Kribbella antiqua]
MAFAKDQWTKAVKQADGTVKRERDEKRWGRGKRWLGVWIDPHGKERSKAFETKVRAVQYATGMETDRDRGDYLDPNAGKARLDELWPRWIGSRTVDPASEIQYESKWRLHVQPMFGRRMVKSIVPSEIAVWLTDLISAHGPSTARGAFLVLNGCLELAVADELIKRNPGQSRIVKKPARRFSKVVAWSDETVDRIIEAHPEEFRLIPIIGSAAGLRQAEIFGLSVDDFDFEEQVIRVRRQVKRLGREFVFALPKNDKERIVPMSAYLGKVVEEHIERFGTTTISLPWERLDGEIQDHALLFTWSDGKQLRARLYDLVVWKPALVAAGVIPPPVKDNRGRLRFKSDRTTGLHALRHYFASITLADGVNIKELSEYLGHHDPGFTLQMYTHMLPSSYDRARHAIDRRLERLALRLTEQSRSRADLGAPYEELEAGPGLI